MEMKKKNKSEFRWDLSPSPSQNIIINLHILDDNSEETKIERKKKREKTPSKRHIRLCLFAFLGPLLAFVHFLFAIAIFGYFAFRHLTAYRTVSWIHFILMILSYRGGRIGRSIFFLHFSRKINPNTNIRWRVFHPLVFAAIKRNIYIQSSNNYFFFPLILWVSFDITVALHHTTSFGLWLIINVFIFILMAKFASVSTPAPKKNRRKNSPTIKYEIHMHIWTFLYWFYRLKTILSMSS